MSADPDRLIAMLDLAPHPEGGWYRETWRDSPPGGGRGAGTAILYLLKQGEASHWHRVRDADEVWYWHAGGPLALSLAAPDAAAPASIHLLGPDIGAGEMPQVIVPKDHWQAARPKGAFTLVSCSVSPAFEFSAFEMAPPGWEPGNGPPPG